MLDEVTFLNTLLKVRTSDKVVVFSIDLAFPLITRGAGYGELQVIALLNELLDDGGFAGAGWCGDDDDLFGWYYYLEIVRHIL